MTAVELCRLSMIKDPGALELEWGESDWPLSLFVVRRRDRAYGYVNRCPHAGHELNLRQNDFLTGDGGLIMCRSHGARFRIEDGLCVLGPCPGARLKPFRVEVVDGIVVAHRDELDGLAAARLR